MKPRISKSLLIVICFFCLSSIYASINTNFTFGFSFADPNGASYTYKIYVKAIGSNWTSNWYTEPAVSGLPSNWGPGTYTGCTVTISTDGDPDDVNYCQFEILILRNDDRYISTTSGWYSWNNPINISSMYIGSF